MAEEANPKSGKLPEQTHLTRTASGLTRLGLDQYKMSKWGEPF